MARINWKALQIEYIRANAKTGVSVKDWCAKKGLNLSTAKRYIKKPETVFEQAEKCEQNCETANIEKQDKSKDYSENCETNCE
ncbi:TPA: terminase, partial [Pasteurella multocida]|nr:terminase [Pasteurella multocida]